MSEAKTKIVELNTRVEAAAAQLGTAGANLTPEQEKLIGARLIDLDQIVQSLERALHDLFR
ncbi:MAG: hypothetical protein ACR2RE_12870 [Geminicoccaceae bacterium]